MREKLIEYVRDLFRYASKTQHNQDLEEEILQNSLDRFDDLTARGVSEENAYKQAVSSIGEVRKLLEQPAYTPVRQPRRKRWGWIVGGICLLLSVLLVGSLVLGWLFTARSFGGRGEDLEDRVEHWADGVEENVEHWVEDALQNSDIVQTFGSRVSYPDAGRYQKGAAPILEPVSRLYIHWIAGTVQLKLWDGDTVVLEETGNRTTEELLRWRLHDGVLTIQYCEAGTYKELPAKDLVVKLPAAVAETLSVKVETVSADCGIDEMNLGRLEFFSTSGSLDAEGVYNSLSAETVSGTVNFRGTAWNTEVETTSGDTKLDFSTTPDELSYEAVSGDLDLILNGGRAFRIELETVSGDLDSNFSLERRDGDYIYLPEGGGSMAEIELNTVSGDIKIQRTQ